jgi:hypothetical protein
MNLQHLSSIERAGSIDSAGYDLSLIYQTSQRIGTTGVTPKENVMVQ